MEEIIQGIHFAHVFGRKIYLTVNTLVKDKELDSLYDFLLPFYEQGLDGVIVQDLGALRFIRTHFPGLLLHASTHWQPWGEAASKRRYFKNCAGTGTLFRGDQKDERIDGNRDRNFHPWGHVLQLFRPMPV